MSTLHAQTIVPTDAGAQFGVGWFGASDGPGRFTMPFMTRDVDLKNRIAYWIWYARDQVKDISRPALAAKVGVGRGAVSDWEKGISVPSLLHLGELCDALGVDADLFAHPPPIPPNPLTPYLRPSELKVAEHVADYATDATLDERSRDATPARRVVDR